jgi:glycosyltransferase involved in cell wall biosynthesis
MELLRRTLDCLARQDLGTGEFEVLVVDDGSSDGTAELVRGYGGPLNLRYFFQPDEGYRVAAARNIGIANATADVCVFLDSGVLAHSGCLSAHMRNYRGGVPTAVVGYVYCFEFGTDDAEEMRRQLDFDDPDGTVAELNASGRWLDIRERFYAKYPVMHSAPAPWLMYWTCNTSATTALLREVGGFDESFRGWGGEDVELAYRLHRRGAVFRSDRAAAALHYPHPKSRMHNKEVARSNYAYMIRKHDTPIMRLLGTELMNDFTKLNDYIVEHRIPSCEEYLAQSRGR